MLIKKDERKIEDLSQRDVFWDYPMPSKEIGIAIQELSGRVPKTGFLRNNVCNEIIYVISGEGMVAVEDEIHEVKEGDVVVIPPGKKSYAEAKGMKAIIITSPDWHSEQCENME